MHRRPALSALFVVAAASLGCAKMLRGYAATESREVLHPPSESAKWSDAEWGGYYALYGDFGSLTTDNLATNAVPWKLVNALADVVPEPFFANGRHGWQPVPSQPLRRFGVVYGAKLAGPPGLVQRGSWSTLPVGYARGTVERTFPDVTLDIASTNCSMCHLGRGWDGAGRPTSSVWWGIPNHSIDFDGIIAAVSRAILDPRATDDALLGAMANRYPETAPAETKTYRKYVLPAFRKAIREGRERWGSLHPWTFGGPGFSHGAAILKDSLADDKNALVASDFPPAWVKIPNVYGVTLKRWLLIDGSYIANDTVQKRAPFIDHLVAFLPVFGTSIERSIEQIPHLEKVFAFLETLTPPPFPGRIDADAATRGKAIYRARCASCHGDQTQEGFYAYPNRRIPVEEIGTDPARARALTPDLVRRYAQTEIGRYEAFRSTGAYMPPPLHGIWASAPYFHNASVPTLWAVLTPSERPRRFLTGGHPFDAKQVGIACEDVHGTCVYPSGYEPWSEPKVYDTSEPGRSNRGHEDMVIGLGPAEKWDLIEYLKVL